MSHIRDTGPPKDTPMSHICVKFVRIYNVDKIRLFYTKHYIQIPSYKRVLIKQKCYLFISFGFVLFALFSTMLYKRFLLNDLLLLFL